MEDVIFRLVTNITENIQLLRTPAENTETAPPCRYVEQVAVEARHSILSVHKHIVIIRVCSEILVLQ
jgi:hypothetical protein